MPITIKAEKHIESTTTKGAYTTVTEETVERVGEVVEVRVFQAQRNMSDTLDYTDHRTVTCTEALVYNGRLARAPRWGGSYAWLGHMSFDVGTELPVSHRFTTVDCSNHFVWRGSDHMTPVADAPETWSEEMKEDYEAWKVVQAQLAEEASAKLEREAEAKRLADLEAERNRPVKGKLMVVAKGRKVKPGTRGLVAVVWNDRVLLKPEGTTNLDDRSVNGHWVAADYLKAV